MKLKFRTALLACTLALGTLTVTSCYNDDTIEEIIPVANAGGENDPVGSSNPPPDSMIAEEEQPQPEVVATL